jgi:transposase
MRSGCTQHLAMCHQQSLNSRFFNHNLLNLLYQSKGSLHFDASVLSEFRGRLINGSAENLLFELLLDQLREAGLLKARIRQRTDSTHVLASIQALNRLECVGEVMRHALDNLARVAPDWIQMQAKPEWFERYARPFEESRLPASRAQRYALAETIGTDGL